MINEELIAFLQNDLENERMHCLFYQQAAATVKGVHREELRELFLKEAQSELVHIDEFATLIVQLGGVPATSVAAMPECMLPTPDNLCLNAHTIESAVALIMPKDWHKQNNLKEKFTQKHHTFICSMKIN